MKIFLSIVPLALSLSAQTTYIVEGNRAAVRTALPAGAAVTIHSDLLPNHTLVTLDERQLRQLGGQFPVFPAGPRLSNGLSAPACPAAYHGPVRPARQELSDWDGPGLGSAHLTYTFGSMIAPGITADQARASFVRAFGEIAASVALTFSPGMDRLASMNIDVFAVGSTEDHGDGYALNGALAHAIPPPPLWPEPWAGDIHWSNSYPWGPGGYDLDAVALHESLHGAGLYEHSMNYLDALFMYYNGVKYLTKTILGDEWRLLTIYAPSQGGGGSPPPEPRDERGDNPSALTITATAPSSTTEETVQVNGTIIGGTSPYFISWTATGGSGAAFSFPLTVPLLAGGNTITITVTDAAYTSRYVTLEVLRGGGGRDGR